MRNTFVNIASVALATSALISGAICLGTSSSPLLTLVLLAAYWVSYFFVLGA